MKKYLSLLISFCFATLYAAAAPSIEEADQMAMDGKFAEASVAYEQILAEGQESAELYYNLGYSYFKQGMLGKAILNFERSKRLNPSDPDVAENLSQAYALTDKMQVVEPIVFDRAWQSFKATFGSDGWAVTFVILFALTIVGIACFLFLDSVAVRKIGFFSAIVLFICALFTLSFSIQKRAEILDPSEAIIMVSSTNLLTSPDKNGSQMAVLHEGTHLTIIDTLGDWIEVRLIDGNIGWLPLNDVEKI